MSLLDDHVVTGTGLVDEDTGRGRFRVHRCAMTAPEVLNRELAEIFNRCWLYVGHTSEVTEPGDYVRRSVGGRPVFMVRARKSGQVKVFHNTCPHRGAVVCRADTGNTKIFQCFYHAWTFDTEGRLTGMPGRDAYEGGADFAELSLREVARVEEYRGFVFACYDPEAVDLVTYLGQAREYLDLVVDAMGEPEIVAGSNQYSINANWKLLVENSIDGYHGPSTHDTYIKYIVSQGTDIRSGAGGGNAGYDLGNGHGVIEYGAPWGRPIAKWDPLFGENARPGMEQTAQDLARRFGESRGHAMTHTNRNLLIFPNLVINDIMAVTVRTLMPTAAGHVEVNAWQLAPRDEAEDVRAQRLDSFLTFLGPGGFATPDDLEALESCQQGFASGGVEWSDISRGMGRDRAKHDDEEQIRAFWRQWQAVVEGSAR
ncbi:aromatic ring-hydroxylating oxygenase subunit alpha [Sciscionella marina]|uniref:aromatic ring-hydroxylating oxygenase subunit alpha n=1 Tax=Sciscionella marina TaxID=508770 RepID=UPI000381E0DB|nr:aromatic ring-hydroxylating dioxygenase subunit alpha [Sciscionella marina]